MSGLAPDIYRAAATELEMIQKQVTIINKLGLHLRAATKLVEMALDFESDITLICNDKIADAKSVMDVLMLAAIVDSVVTIQISGGGLEEEEEALRELAALINNRFGEDE